MDTIHLHVCEAFSITFLLGLTPSDNIGTIVEEIPPNRMEDTSLTRELPPPIGWMKSTREKQTKDSVKFIKANLLIIWSNRGIIKDSGRHPEQKK